jgi:hypothetical protein
MSRWERLTLSAILLAATCVSCGPLFTSRYTPDTPRPDTRLFRALTLDSVALATIGETFVAALPAEAALCLEGRPYARDGRVDAIEVNAARPAPDDSADNYHVYFGAQPICGDAIGITHDHPYSVGRACTHSDADALLLAGLPQLFSLVFCADGQGELLWQDGRRQLFRWRP